MANIYWRNSTDGEHLQTGDENPLPVKIYDANGDPLVAPQFDATDRQAVSIYGKSTAAGDTPVLVDSAGRIILGAGVAADSLGKAEDAVHASGDVGVMALAVRANTAAATGANGDYVPLLVDTNGGLWVSLATKIAGEDLTNDRLLTMPKYSFISLAADAQVKAGAGVLHTLTFSTDAAATAGSIILYDSLTETGTVIFTWTIPAAYFVPFTLILDAAFSTGLYAGFTTTADVTMTVTYL